VNRLDAPGADRRREQLREAARDLEALVLKQLVTASGAFGGGEGPGAAVRADLFASTLADALAGAGGIGLAAHVERSFAPGGAGAPAPVPGPPPSSPRGLVTPLAGTVTSAFGPRADPFTGEPARHRGVDVAAPEGAEIRAVAGGTVVFAGERGGYGRAVEIDHGGGRTSLYAHASELRVVEGERVRAGAVVARVGSSGRATGPHLHFELRQDDRAVDPTRALKEYRDRADGRSGAGR
jgi:murein DD-endopeptidase MepM/ murein hydrolase activator NlpD